MRSQARRKVQAFTLEGVPAKAIGHHAFGDLGGLSVDDRFIYCTDEDEHCVWRLCRAGDGGFVAAETSPRVAPRGAPAESRTRQVSSPGSGLARGKSQAWGAQIAQAAQQIAIPTSGLGFPTPPP